jgi:hypothetical protein
MPSESEIRAETKARGLRIKTKSKIVVREPNTNRAGQKHTRIGRKKRKNLLHLPSNDESAQCNFKRQRRPREKAFEMIHAS